MSTATLTTPQKFLLTQMRGGATLRSRPGAGVSPWLEIPGTTKVLYVSALTVAGLFDRKLIEHDTLPDPTAWRNTIRTWHLTPAGQEVDCT